MRVALLALLGLVGCAEPAPAPPPAPTAAPTPGPEDAARRDALAARFDPACDTEALAELRTLRERWGSEWAGGALTKAFTTCGQPSAIADLLAELMSAQPSYGEQLALGAALIRASRYLEAAELLEPLVADAPPRSQGRWLAGFALLHAGQAEQALPLLQDGRAHASGPGASEGPLSVGLALLQLERAEEARPELEQAVALVPDNPTALSALARLHAARGDAEQARVWSERTRQAHARLEERERIGGQLAALSAALKTAWEAGDLAVVEGTIDRMWPIAPESLRGTLLEYRIQVFEKTGRAAEAEAAAAELKSRRAP